MSGWVCECLCVCVQHVARPCTALPFMQLQSVQYASDLQNLLSIPQRPASPAQRLFPVVEEQHDSLPVLCVKKHQVCPPPLPPVPVSSIMDTGSQGRKAVSNTCYFLFHSLCIWDITNKDYPCLNYHRPTWALNTKTVNPVSLVLFEVNASNIHFKTEKVKTVTMVMFKCQSRSSIATLNWKSKADPFGNIVFKITLGAFMDYDYYL